MKSLFNPEVFQRIESMFFLHPQQLWDLEPTVNEFAKENLRTPQEGKERLILGFTRKCKKIAEYNMTNNNSYRRNKNVNILKWQWNSIWKELTEKLIKTVHERSPGEYPRPRGGPSDRCDKVISRVVGFNRHIADVVQALFSYHFYSSVSVQSYIQLSTSSDVLTRCLRWANKAVNLAAVYTQRYEKEVVHVMERGMILETKHREIS